MIQAWDFVPGTNFIDFMDRGLSEAKAVVAVLSRNYLRSRYGRLEWMAALRADPDDPARKLVTVRIEDCPIDGLLSTITYVDLVGIDDPDEARGLLMRRIQEALAYHARPLDGPGFPAAPFQRASCRVAWKGLRGGRSRSGSVPSGGRPSPRPRSPRRAAGTRRASSSASCTSPAPGSAGRSPSPASRPPPPNSRTASGAT